MKNIFYKIALAGSLFLAVSCNTDSFLDRQPQDEFSAQAVFNNFESIKTYAWQFYDAFPAYEDRGWYTNTDLLASAGNFSGKYTVQLRRGKRDLAMWSDADTDLMDLSDNNSESNWIWQRVETPNSDYDYLAPYQNIRAINTMLDGLENTTGLTEAERDHWKSVAWFFRAYNHASLLNRYGDIIYVDVLLNDLSPELFSARSPRDEVAQKILDELIWARDHIGNFPYMSELEGQVINQDVINAFICRFGLLEGTWRKYHGLANANTFLQASVTAGEPLLNKYTLHNNYDELFNSESLEGVNGMILYKKYADGATVHRTTQETRNGNAGEDLTKKAADLYLMTDGQTRWTSPLFLGDQRFQDEHKNRDLRFNYTITPPYKIKSSTNAQGYEFTGNASDQEFFPLMESLSDGLHKTLPSDQWQGRIATVQPNFTLNQAHGWNRTGTGYRCWKYYNRLVTGTNNVDINDAPIFRLGEVMVNYAEAAYELGQFNQGVCDNTINKLRARGGVAPLTVNAEPADPTRDPEISPTLWEIRRERAVELMAEGFRFDDIRRWKKGEYLGEQKLGRWIDKTGSNLNTSFNFSNMPIQDNLDKGYIAMDPKPPGFPEHYYLQPIPLNELLLNSELTQNQGW